MSQSLAASKSMDIAVKITDTGELSTFISTLKTGVGNFGEVSRALTNGTGAGQANKVFYDQRSIGAGADDDINLKVLTDRFGATLAFTKIKWMFVRIVLPATGVKLVFGGGTNAFLGPLDGTTPTHDIHDIFDITNQIDGWTVDDTHKNLRLSGVGATVTYDLLLVGNG